MHNINDLSVFTYLYARKLFNVGMCGNYVAYLLHNEHFAQEGKRRI